MAQQQPAYIRMQDPETSVTQPQTVQPGGYKAAAGRSTGGIQIACGALSIALGISELFFSYFTVGWPIWGGVLYVVAGSLGVPAKKGRNCLIIAYMVMSIISACSAAGQLIWESFGASIHNCSGDYLCSRVAFGLHLAAGLIAVFEMIAAIIGSAFCCHGVYYTTNQTTSFVAMAQQQHGLVSFQPPVASVTQPQTVQPGDYKASAGRSTGGIQIACGALSIALGISEIFFSYWAVVGWPIWGGVLYVVTGSLGVPTKKGRNCLIIAYMAMSIISACSAAGQLIWESFGALIADADCYSNDYYYCNGVAFGLHLAVVLIAAFEMLAAIIGSVNCCRGVCCTTNQTTPIVVQDNPQMQQQTGQIYLQQQVAPAQYQPPPGAPMQHQPPGAPMQYQSPAAPES